MKVLIKVSGKVIDNENELKKFITAAKKYYSKDKVLIVHGGGKQVSRWSEKFGIKPKFVDGLRFTDESVLGYVVFWTVKHINYVVRKPMLFFCVCLIMFQ